MHFLSAENSHVDAICLTLHNLDPVAVRLRSSILLRIVGAPVALLSQI